jgi:nitrite reductase/ring-hydroxylating ferredoxin subunit
LLGIESNQASNLGNSSKTVGVVLVMAIRRRELIGGGIALAGLMMAGPAAFGQEVNLGQTSQLKVGGAKVFSVGKTRILVIRRTTNRFDGFIARCPHDKNRLTATNFKSGRITCSKDKSVFSSSTGKKISGPSSKGLKRVPLKVTSGFLIATLATAPSPAPSDDALVDSSKVPVGSGIKVQSKVGVLMLVQPTKGNFAAFSAVCTHAGCQVSKVTSKEITCTCHNSQFSTADGRVLQGPATKSLEQFEVVERVGKLYLR